MGGADADFRLRAVRQYLEGETRTQDHCRAFGISERTLQWWAQRYRDQGTEGLRDRSRRPDGSPRQTPSRVEARILRMRRPPKEYAANPKLITPDEYDELLARIQDLAERLVVRLLHDSLLRPSDVVTVRLADLAEVNGVLVIRRRTKKTGKVSESFLTKDTALELRAYVASQAITDYLFSVNGHPRHRTWPNVVLRKHGAEGVTPRTFRRTGATAWNDDLASLMSQGAWNDPKTILAHYRRDVHARHRSAFEGAIGKATDEDPDKPKGYA